MTLDELFEKYHEAWSAVARQTDGDMKSAGRAGVTAIVRALRDEVVPPTKSRAASSTMLTRHVLAGFDEILGDAGEKVAEYTGGMNDLCVTDAAPAVCVWTKHAEKRWSIQCTPHGFFNPTPKRLAAERCAMCKAPIKFTEANHG